MDFLALLLPLSERMVLIWFFAYLFSQTKVFWNLVKSRVTLKDKVLFVVLFGTVSILGTYLGIRLNDGAIANIRPVGAIVAGLIGGPWLGGIVGLVSGLQRWSLGGITGFACGVATIAEGLAGGFVGLKAKKNFLDIRWALVAGIVGEILQIGIVLLLTKPFEQALAIERIVAIPMIVVNTIGVLGFVIIIRDAFAKHNGMIISQFNRFVEIERRMSAAVQSGLNTKEADSILTELSQRTELRGIFLLKDRELLSSKGPESEILPIVEAWLARSSEVADRVKVSIGKSEIVYYCVPIQHLLNNERITIGVKLQNKSYYDDYFAHFTDHLAELLGNQIHEVTLIELQDKMATAQLKALKAQIQPHFLFNALSTISSFCRTDGVKARELILDLANYFRKTIDQESDQVSLRHELELIHSYLSIEKARLGDRLRVVYEIPESVMEVQIPSFLIQPLVENAVKHGIANMTDGGELKVLCLSNDETLHIEIANSREEGVETQKGCGQALRNIQERMALLYGDQGGFELDCGAQLAVARLRIPMGEQV